MANPPGQVPSLAMVLGASPDLRDSTRYPIRVLVADDEPALRSALSDLLAHEDGVVLIGTAADADEAIEVADNHQPDVALVDVKMPAGGGEKAARGIVRVSPGTRVIALSAFEDRPTVLAMLRAGAVGYLVKGTGAEEIVNSIERVMAGGTSLSPEVIGGIVQELTSQLRKEEIEEESREARRGEIERFMAGDGLSMVFQPIVDLHTRAVLGMEALARFRSLPLRPPNEWFAEAVQLELGVQLELTTVRQALRALPRSRPTRSSPSTAHTERPSHLSSRRSCRSTRRASWSRSRSTRPSRTTTRCSPGSETFAPPASASPSTTPEPGSRAFGTPCASRPTS